MTAHWVVLAAAALTTLVAAAVGAALAAFAGQALPQAVRHDLVVAPGTYLAVSGTFAGGNAAQTSAGLRSTIGTTLGGVPFGFWQGIWSDPLGFVPGALPARPASAGSGNTPLLEAASLTGVEDHAVLVSGSWPGQPTASPGAPIPTALPASAAALLRLSPGDVLQVRDRNSNAALTFKITGLYAERRTPASAASYWQLNSIPASGSTTSQRLRHLRALGRVAGRVPRPTHRGNRKLGRPARHGRLRRWQPVRHRRRRERARGVDG